MLAGQNINIIPQPKKVAPGKSFFVLKNKTSINYNDQQLKFLAGYVSNALKSFNNLELRVKMIDGTEGKSRSVNLMLDPNAGTIKEGYKLSV